MHKYKIPKANADLRRYALWKNLTFTAISAWAWGYHRAVDALMTEFGLKDE